MYVDDPTKEYGRTIDCRGAWFVSQPHDGDVQTYLFGRQTPSRRSARCIDNRTMRLTDINVYERDHFADALEQSEEDRAVARLYEALFSETVTARLEAVDAMARIGLPVVPALISALNEGNADIGYCA